MKRFIHYSIFIIVLISAASVSMALNPHDEVLQRVGVLDELKNNYLHQFYNQPEHNIERIEYYSFELFKKHCENFSYVSTNTDMKLLFAFFKELYFNHTDKLSLLFSYYDYYFNKFQSVFVQNNISENFFLLPAVLTAYNNNYDNNNTCGFWRLNYPVAIKCGLTINSKIDDRKDPFLSSQAACTYMSHLKKFYKNTDIALAAFMSSPVFINNKLKEYAFSTNFTSLLSKDMILDYHFYKTLVLINNLRDDLKILSAEIKFIHNTEKVFFEKKIHFETLIQKLGISEVEFAFYNPSLKRKTFLDSIFITLPIVYKEKFDNINEEIFTITDSLYMFELESIKDDEVIITKETVYHVVKRGETLSQIANRYKNVSVEDIVRVNKLKSPDVIREGQKLIIK